MLSMRMLPDNESRTTAYTLAKGLFSFIGGVIGYNVAIFLLNREMLSAPINLFYLTTLGVLLFYLFSSPLARRWETWWQRLTHRASRIPPQSVLAAGIGVMVALVITVLLNTLLEAVPGFTWYWSLLITLVLVSASSWFFVTYHKQFAVFNLLAGRTGTNTIVSENVKRLKIIDTSAIIDGRITEIVEANFIDGQLLIPRFILNELQNIADSSDPLRRNRGRRGLEVLDKLVEQERVTVKVITDDVPDVDEVDEKLIRLCLSKQGRAHHHRLQLEPRCHLTKRACAQRASTCQRYARYVFTR